MTGSSPIQISETCGRWRRRKRKTSGFRSHPGTSEDEIPRERFCNSGGDERRDGILQIVATDAEESARTTAMTARLRRVPCRRALRRRANRRNMPAHYCAARGRVRRGALAWPETRRRVAGGQLPHFRVAACTLRIAFSTRGKARRQRVPPV
jgi:hypothetical protein